MITQAKADARGSVTEVAYAKLNLTLEVLHKREDGYHEVASLMQTIGIVDRVTMAEADELRVTCSDLSLITEDNLARRAALDMATAAGVEPRVAIHIEKRIPKAAGLGGGSADAAAVLRGLNRLWKLRFGYDELAEIGSRIGSDVPFLIRGGTALATGTGTDIEQLPNAELGRIVVAVPMAEQGFETTDAGKTHAMYGMLRPMAFTNGSLTRRLAARVRQGGDCHPGFMFNVFQQLAARAFPNWQKVYDDLARLGARDIFLTGSGPAMFAFAPDKAVGTAWCALLQRRVACDAFATDAVFAEDTD